MTPAERIISGVTAKLHEHRAVLDATPNLNTVVITIRLGHKGDRVIVQTESGYLGDQRGSKQPERVSVSRPNGRG